MHRFFVDPAQAREPVVELSERESHHALNVVRVEVGERVALLDGQGSELSCQVEQLGKRSVTVKVYQRNTVPPLPYRLTLLQAIPKGKTMETIVEKATELGAARVIPILAERTVAQLDPARSESKVEKWNWIAIDAIKQCGSAWLPQISEPVKPSQQLASGDRFELTLVASLQPDARHPRLYFREFLAEKQRLPKSIAVWIGPEGDFTPAEMNAIRAHGALPITLGPLVLRSETAALYALSVLSCELQAPGQ